jgi:hypothetical protein
MENASPSATSQIYKGLYFFGFIAYAFLFLFAVLFFKERTIFADIAYQLFVLITDGFSIQNFRFGAIGTEVFPLAAARIHLPLASVMMVYSIALVLYHFLYYLLIGLVLKKYDFALVLLLFHTIFVSDTFYWIQSELPQGISLFILMLAVGSAVDIQKIKSAFGIGALVLLSGGMFVVAFMHPLIIVPVLFALCFLLLSQANNTINSKAMLFIALPFFVEYAVKFLFFKNDYDANVIAHSVSSFCFESIFRNYHNKHFLQNCLVKYYWVPVLSAAITAFYARKRAWLKLALFVSFAGGYLLLVNVTHPDNKATDFYIENLYLPLGLFIAFPLVFDILPTIQKREIAFGVLFILMISGALRIYQTHTVYTDRLVWERDFLKENLNKKLIIDARSVPKDVLLMTWASPYEFWLLSTTEFGQTASIMIADDPAKYTEDGKDSKNFVTKYYPIPYYRLPKEYFMLRDSVSTYSAMNDRL